ncbi:MAG: DUF262 domain-containing protein [Bacteroidales bacterium]
MAQNKLSMEKLEAIDNQVNAESIPYLYDTKEYPVEVITEKYKKDQIFVPHYQRNFVWNIKQRSKFIESVFLGVPIMPFLVSVSGEEAELEIIDGSQRIRTLVAYCNDEFKLSGLEKLVELNGTKFSYLNSVRQNKFKLRDFRFHVVTENATAEVRADIFNRVNTSSNKLSASETRKGVYQGDFYNFILECSKNVTFRTICPISPSKIERGEYEELVLRFFAYSDRYLEFKHDVSAFLDKYVKDHKNNFNKEALECRFKQMVDFIHNNFPAPYFAKAPRDKATPRVRFEALAVGAYLALKENNNLEIGSLAWLDSNEFKDLTTSDASNNTGRLRGRVEFVKKCLLGNINIDDLKYE